MFTKIFSGFLSLVMIMTVMPGLTIKKANAQIADTGISIQGVSATSPFSQTNNCGSVLSAGESCNVDVTFTPTGQSFSSGQLVINTSAGQETVSLSGTGVSNSSSSPEPVGNITYYKAPSGSDFSTPRPTQETIKIWPAINDVLIKNGQRLSGTVTIGGKGMNSYGYTFPTDNYGYRLVIDGVPHEGFSVNTNTLQNGSHHFAIQVFNRNGEDVIGAHVVVVVNNSNLPLTQKTNQVVAEYDFKTRISNNLAFAKVDVGDPVAYPLGFNLAKHPVPTTDAERESLVTEPKWWIDGLNNQGTALYYTMPMIAKNEQGDYFVAHWNPQDNASSTHARRAVVASPQFDGQRNIGIVSPYSTFIADTKVLGNGYTGWIGVDITGRIMEMDNTGEIHTIYGPRSVAGKVQTTPYLYTWESYYPVNDSEKELTKRINSGEKEVVRGRDIKTPTDLSVVGDTIWVADHSSGKIFTLNRNSGGTTVVHNIEGVSSIWQNGTGGPLYAVASDGLYENGVFKAAIPDGFWVRGIKGGNVYVLDRRMAFWEYNVSTKTVQKVSADLSALQDFVFFDIDTKGLIGPKNRFYYSMVNSFNSNTGVRWTDIGDWQPYEYTPGVINNSQQAIIDPFGHYVWGFSIHDNLSQFIVSGISNTSWKLWTSHLGDIPTEETGYRIGYNIHPNYSSSRDLWSFGITDVMVPPAVMWGHNGTGQLGLTVDAYRDLLSVDEIKTAISTKFPSLLTDEQLTDLAWFTFWNRSRKHFLPTTTAINVSNTTTFTVADSSFGLTSAFISTFTDVINKVKNSLSSLFERATPQFATVSSGASTLAASPSSISFGNVPVGSTSGSKTITIAVSGIITDPTPEPDTTAPSIPVNLSSTGVSSTTISITWAPSTDNVAVTGYNVYKNGVKSGSVSNTSFTSTGLQSDTTYIYTVSAYDAANNESVQSTPLQIKTAAESPDIGFSIVSQSATPSAGGNASISVVLSGPGSVLLEYGNSSGNLKSSKESISQTINHQFDLTNLTGSAVYYRITATSQIGQVSIVESSFALTQETKGTGGGKGGAGGGKTKNTTTSMLEPASFTESTLETQELSDTERAKVSQQISELLTIVQSLQFQLIQRQGGSIGMVGSTVSLVAGQFTRNLAYGSVGEDVRMLQVLLNKDPDTRINSELEGALGQETTFFGKKTEEAVKRYQTKYGIVSTGTPESTGYGAVGPQTRAHMNTM